MPSETRLLAQLVELARAQGARGAEALLEEGEGMTVRAVRGRVADRTDTGRRELAVRVWLEGGRPGAARGPLDPGDDGADLLATALTAAEAAPPDPHGGPAARLPGAPARGLGIEDRRHGQLTAADRADVAVTAERSARGVDRRVVAEGFFYEDERVERSFASSRGVTAYEAGTRYSAGGAVRVPGDAGDLRLTDRIDTRSFSSIVSIPYGVNLAKRAIDLLKTGPSPEGPARVMLPPRAVADLVAAMAPGFENTRFERGQTFLARRREPPPTRGMVSRHAGPVPLFDPRFHLLDDGTLPGALRTTSFDDRGVGPVALTLVRDGHVDARYLGVEDAHRLDARPTGHENAGVVSPRNLLVRQGTRSMNAILADGQKRVFFVDHLRELRLDPLTGLVEAVASGWVQEGSTTLYAVQAVSLSGDLADVLHGIVEVSSDCDRHGHVDAAGMLVDGFVLTPR